jgi:hypothetical protein
MTWLLRAIRALSLTLWIGGIAFFAFVVAVVAFRDLPSAHLAGIVVRGSLTQLHRIGMIAAIAYLAATMALIATSRDSHVVRAVEILLAVAMLIATVYSQFLLIPRMEEDRLAAGGDISTTAADSPAHLRFDRLHKRSEHVEGFILLGGLMLVLMAPLHQRERLG